MGAAGAVMKVKDVIRLLEEDGWFLVATRQSGNTSTRFGRTRDGSRQPSDDLAPGTLNSILKQSGLKDQG
jgi:predicted RNA binding protein YcfA (HicA-like mRNA interferase family)